jgi:hypothetical protein
MKVIETEPTSEAGHRLGPTSGYRAGSRGALHLGSSTTAPSPLTTSAKEGTGEALDW